MNIITKFLFGFGFIALFFVIETQSLQAAYEVQPGVPTASGCFSGEWITKGGNGTKAEIKITNKSTCPAGEVSFCSYRVYVQPKNPGWLSQQTLFDSQKMIVQPGQSVIMSVDTDYCMNQVDAFEWDCLEFVNDGVSPSLIKGSINSVTNLCTRCTDECSTINQRVCDGNGWKQCRKEPDGCYHWTTVTDCESDETCNNGSCIADQPALDLSYTGSVSCNKNATLLWTSSHVSSCAASGSWSGAKPSNGSESTGSFVGKRTYTLTCYGKGGSISDSVTLDGDNYDVQAHAGSDKYLNETDDEVRLDGSVDGDYDSITWSCTGGRLSDSGTLRPTWELNYNFGDSDYSSRTYTCTMTARNECGSDSDTMKITVERRQKDFNVSLIARPKSDCAPLENVDLIATVTNYGSNTGDFTYYFDCENDGIWDKIVSDDSADYTAVDLCDYRNVGSYTARVKATRSGKEASDTEVVKAEACGIPQQTGRVSITKSVANLTQNSGYQGTVSANPLDTVSYKIIVTGASGTTDNVWVSDAVPAGITNIREVAVDGQAAGGTLGSLELGTLRSGQARTITYTATVANASSFVWGQTTLTNVATVHAGSDSADSRAAVTVYRRAVQGATTVSTGLGSNMIAGLAIALAGAVFCLAWILATGKKAKKASATARLEKQLGL